MKGLRLLAVFALLGQNLAPAWAALGAAAPDPIIIEQENGLRREAEEKIQRDILDRILGVGRATVMVNVEVSLESEKKESALQEGKVDDKKGLGDQDYILPWVPAPKTVNKANEVPKDAKITSSAGEQASTAVRQIVSRFDVTVIHDDTVNQDELKLVDETIRSAYIRFEKIIRLIYKATRYSRDKDNKKDKVREEMWDFLKPGNLLQLGFLMALMMGLMLLWSVLRGLMKAMGARKGSDVMSETLMKLLGENENKDEQEQDKTAEELAAEQAALEEEMKKEEKFVPFAYINETNLDRLAALVHRESPEIIAIILSYLLPEFVKKVLQTFSPALQAKVALHMAAMQQTTEAEIRALDADVKAKIDFLVGGLPSLVKVLEDLDYSTRDNILEYLKNDRPNLYEKIRKRILVFEDVANFPDVAMQFIVRELKAESLARALQDAPPAVREKFFKNMSRGAADLLKEEMELGKALSPEQVQEERQKILATVKTLETSGKIKIRENGGSEVLDFDDLDLMTGAGLSKLVDKAVAPAPVDAQKAQEYSTAGQQFYTEQRYGEALSYFQYAAQMDPSSAEIQQFLGNTYYALGQLTEALQAFEQAVALNPADEGLRQWVEQFRTTVSAAAG